MDSDENLSLRRSGDQGPQNQYSFINMACSVTVLCVIPVLQLAGDVFMMLEHGCGSFTAVLIVNLVGDWMILFAVWTSGMLFHILPAIVSDAVCTTLTMALAGAPNCKLWLTMLVVYGTVFKTIAFVFYWVILGQPKGCANSVIFWYFLGRLGLTWLFHGGLALCVVASRVSRRDMNECCRRLAAGCRIPKVSHNRDPGLQ